MATEFAPLADLKTFGLRIPSLSTCPTSRAIGRLLDAALAVPGGGSDIDARQHPPCDWYELLSDWVDIARRNDEDVRLDTKHYDAVPGQIYAWTVYKVLRREGCLERTLLSVDVTSGGEL